MNLIAKIFSFLFVVLFSVATNADNVFHLPQNAHGFIQVDDIKKNEYRQIVYAKENKALSIIYNFSKNYDFKKVLMSEVQNLQKIKNLPSGKIKYFSSNKLKSMGSHFDAVLFTAFPKQGIQRFDITALAKNGKDLIKIRYTGLDSENLQSDFKSAMVISEAFLANLINTN